MSQYTSSIEGGFCPFVGSAGEGLQGQATSGSREICEPKVKLRWVLALGLERIAFSDAPIFGVSRRVDSFKSSLNYRLPQEPFLNSSSIFFTNAMAYLASSGS